MKGWTYGAVNSTNCHLKFGNAAVNWSMHHVRASVIFIDDSLHFQIVRSIFFIYFCKVMCVKNTLKLKARKLNEITIGTHTFSRSHSSF